jgi:hypothetical protein
VTPRSITLGRYVRARNGVPLGAGGSLENMLRRSFGAPSFAGFWRHWNPIWGYYLGRYVFRPADRVLPRPLAVIATFVVSGAVHDLVITTVRPSASIVFTPWFLLISVVVVLGEALGMDLSRRPWIVRAAAHVTLLGATLWTVLRIS